MGGKQCVSPCRTPPLPFFEMERLPSRGQNTHRAGILPGERDPHPSPAKHLSPLLRNRTATQVEGQNARKAGILPGGRDPQSNQTCRENPAPSHEQRHGRPPLCPCQARAPSTAPTSRFPSLKRNAHTSREAKYANTPRFTERTASTNRKTRQTHPSPTPKHRHPRPPARRNSA